MMPMTGSTIDFRKRKNAFPFSYPDLSVPDTLTATELCGMRSRF